MKRDIIGQRFGRLVAMSFKGAEGKARYRVICDCDCGAQTELYLYSLTAGYTKSCGCLNREMAAAKMRTHGFACEDKRKRTPEYSVWMQMRRRCLRPHDHAFKDYGGRGIDVVKEWDDFAVFLRDMGSRPNGTLLERIDNNKGYGPKNCKWASRLEQARNKRNNVKLTFGGETLCAAQWAERTGLPHKMILRRVRYGWPVERILNAPPGGG